MRSPADHDGSEPAGRVRQEDARDAEPRHGARPVDDRFDGVPFVEVNAPLHAHDRDAEDLAEAEVAAVTRDA